MSLRRRPNEDTLVLILFGVLLLFWAHQDAGREVFDPRAAFGGEYGYLAESLLRGDGFSGPFGRSTHPSAWMPPLLSVVIGGIFLLFGVETTASAGALLYLDACLVWFSLWLLLRVARESDRPGWCLGLLFAGYLWLDRLAGKAGFHDTGWVMMLSCLALYSLLSLSRGKVRPAIVTAVLLPLSSPSLALAYVILLPFAGARRRTVILVFACWAATVGGWTVRNAVALRSLIPVKSNLWFDFQQANVLDPDGVVTSSTFVRHHPMLSRDVGDYYREHGEGELLQWSRKSSIGFLRNHPGEYLAKTVRRLENATLFLHNSNDLVEVGRILPADVQAGLMKEHLVVGSEHGAQWACLDLGPEAVRQRLLTLPEEKRETLLLDWKRARLMLDERESDGLFIVWGLAHGLLPTLAFLLGWVRREVRQSRVFRTAAWLYAIFLAPYILVSHYQRYSEALVGLSAVLVWHHFPALKERNSEGGE